MLFDVQGKPAYARLEGSEGKGPAIVLVHGAQNDHSVWTALAQGLGARGHRVLAADLPGHGNSAGPALGSVEDMAGWLLALLDAAGIAGPDDGGAAILAGHSMGSLVALEAAARAPGRAAGIVLLGTAYPMRVAESLLAGARDDEAAAIEMVARWSHSELSLAPSAGDPALSIGDAARALMRRLSEINPERLLYTDLAACNAYAGGERAAGALRCPALLVLGRRDKMTPARAAARLKDAIAHATLLEVDAGHAMMAERPGALLEALDGFARSCV
ncbi:alpha/beta fold hydrolase [Massilia forsythiae]|uniref:Alpha/beta fold hydrolase n=1 Tax=Massilia forsythiae TaxID=2728020 RepID=A0A7Z2ZUG9_9BURK|nr:alpha/beta fold hydrolase [Massilia forsythiae]QJE02548.1 alpha/beta fold hydrolase [Massilia forsythiae]